MSLCLASYPVWTDCAALIVLLTVCLYHCQTTISGHELVLGILPCLNWLCCTNCSPHCVSVSLSDDHLWTCAWHLTCFNWLCCTNCSPHCVSVSLSADHFWTWAVLGILPCLNWLCCTNCSPHCVSVSLSDDHHMSLCLASPPVSTDCAALIVLLTVCLYHCRPTISGLVLGILPCLNWLCCTNCSPHCVSVSLSDDHFWTWACAWHLTLFELTVLH